MPHMLFHVSHIDSSVWRKAMGSENVSQKSRKFVGFVPTGTLHAEVHHVGILSMEIIRSLVGFATAVRHWLGRSKLMIATASEKSGLSM